MIGQNENDLECRMNVGQKSNNLDTTINDLINAWGLGLLNFIGPGGGVK